MTRTQRASGRARTACCAALLAAGVAACSTPTVGPVVRIDETGWTADPPSVVQQGDRFRIVVENTLDTDVEFVLLRLDYGDVVDLPLVGGVVDLSQGVVYDGETPIVAYGAYPEVVDDTEWEPWCVEAESSITVTVGTSLGGGEPGRFAVVSYRPGAIEARAYAVFDMTEEDGEVPRLSFEDFHHPGDEG